MRHAPALDRPIRMCRRYRPTVRVAARVQSVATGAVTYHLVHDIGEGGAYLETQSPFAQGTHLILQILLPWTRVRVNAYGQVVWSQCGNGGNGAREARPSGVGINFVHLPAEDLCSLNKVLKENPNGILQPIL